MKTATKSFKDGELIYARGDESRWAFELLEGSVEIIGEGDDAVKVGHFLENPITNVGCAYILEQAMRADGDKRVVEFWLNHYKEEIDNYLLLHPKHPYHITAMRATLQEISNDCQRILNAEPGSDTAEDLLAAIINEIQDKYRIFCEVEDNVDKDGDEEDGT